jgi:rubredoxin
MYSPSLPWVHIYKIIFLVDNIRKSIKEFFMDENDRYQCIICNYIYDPEYGDPDAGADALPGTSFQDLPDYWVCPHCGAEKEDFENID